MTVFPVLSQFGRECHFLMERLLLITTCRSIHIIASCWNQERSRHHPITFLLIRQDHSSTRTDFCLTMMSSSPTSILSQSLAGEELSDNNEESWTTLQASKKSLRTTNPIRAIVDPIVANLGQQTHDKSFLSLAARSLVLL